MAVMQFTPVSMAVLLINGLALVRILHGDDHLLVFGQIHARSKERLVESFIEGLRNTQTLTCGFHFRSQADLGAPDLLKGEYRHLDGKIVCLRLKSRLIAKLPDGLADNDLCGKIHDRDTRYLADIRHGT